MRFLVLLIFYSILYDADKAFGKLCTRRVPVHETRRVWRTSVRVVTYRNWMGWIKTQLQPYSYYDTELYLTYRIESECCFGYSKVNGNCEPLCPSGCPANAYCSQPFICTCNAGHIWSYSIATKEFCAPICENDCPAHSKCTAPNVCECEPNYERDGNTRKCEPKCEMECPTNAYCAEPNTCQCRNGYELKASSSGNIICEPICEAGCQMRAQCVAPNECACEPGYEMIDGNCEPKCEPNCGANSYCQAPNNCVCNRGYEFRVADRKCTPICSTGCHAYSYCVEPETCACDVGYTMNENATQCLPVCEAGCPLHSVCFKPAECLCDEGFRPKQLPDANKTMECERICPANCEPYGRCRDSGTCECHPGYVLQTENQPSKATEPLCRPHCSQECTNAFCFSPETCVCNPGFLMGPNSTCKPICSLGCMNAECVEPEICVCLPGHRFKQGSVSECEPICEPACFNGDCVAPDLCLCQVNFEPDSEHKNRCKPSCIPGCLNGDCLGPQNCSCWQGYQLSTANNHECRPVCSDCEFGECVSPEVCSCSEDFYEARTENGTTCLPVATTKELQSTTTSEGDDELPASECGIHCKCWQAADHNKTFQSASCENICEDNADGDPCLNLNDCSCQLTDSQLRCEIGAKIYRCLMPFNIQASSIKLSKLNPAPHNASRFPWIITLCSVFCGVLMVSGLFIIWRSYQSSRNLDNDLIIEFQN